MPTEMGQIGLGVAERNKPVKGAFDYRSANTERWIADLPAGNVGETARQVYETLQQVNRYAISWKDRYRFLELLREPLHYVTSSLNSRLTPVTFPLPEKSERIANLAKLLFNEMALGYKNAIDEMLSGSFLGRDNKILTILIHRATSYLNQSLLICFQTYSPHPNGTWKELHAMYQYAERKDIHRDGVTDKFNEAMPECSIARVYKQIMLLALASPYRLRQGEAGIIYSALGRYATYAHILPYNSSATADVLFSVQLDSDRAPDYLVFNNEECDENRCRLIDTRELSQIICDEQEKHTGLMGSGEIPAELVIRLIRSWGIAPKRSFSRSGSNSANVIVAIGLTSMYRVLAHAQGIKDLHIHRSSYNTRTVSGVSQPTDEDVWDIRGSSVIKKDYEHYESITEPAHYADLPDTTYTWQILNESAGGYRFSLDKASQAGLKVGEILGINRTGDSTMWEIGVIRWLRQGNDKRLEIGVQVLAPHAKPVMLCNERNKAKSSEYQYSLLLTEIPALKQPATLLTPSLLFKPGYELSLYVPGQRLIVKLKEKAQDTGSFTQFTYRLVNNPPVRKETTPQKQVDDLNPDGFGKIWDEL